jgi:hypothetical protein
VAQEVDFTLLEPQLLYNAYPLEDAIDKNPMPVEGRLLGERVYFVGFWTNSEQQWASQ